MNTTETNWNLSVLYESATTANPTDWGRPTILADTREKKPYDFQRFGADVESRSLKTGDYTIKGYENLFAVERKSMDDFLRSVGTDHDRFREEVKRADSFECPMAIVIEAPWEFFKNEEYDRKVHSNVITGTVEGWDVFNIEWHFEENRLAAEQKTFNLLTGWLEQCKSH